MQNNVKAGFNLSCLGDDLAYSLIHTPNSDTIADKIALHVLKDKPNFTAYDFLASGSDERQYCSPLVNLPVCGVCRSKYGEFDVYHTSLDDLSFISQKGLEGGLEAIKQIITTLELNAKYVSAVFCEPNLGKRGLYPTISQATHDKSVYYYRKFLALCDGRHDVIDIAERLGVKAYELGGVVKALIENKLIKQSNV